MKHIQILPIINQNTLVIKDLTKEGILYCIYDMDRKKFSPTVFSLYENKLEGISFDGLTLPTRVYEEFLSQRNG